MSLTDKDDDLAPQHSWVKMRSIDGNVYFITCKNPIDYVLHRDFIRFVIIVCAFYALAHGDTDVPGVTGWPYVAIWTMVFSFVILWLVLSGKFTEYLIKKKYITEVWTALLLFPLNLIIEFSVQVMMYWFVDQPLKTWGVVLADLTRDFSVLLLMDLLHGHYVVAQHPYARNSRVYSSEGLDGQHNPPPNSLAFDQRDDQRLEPAGIASAARRTSVEGHGDSKALGAQIIGEVELSTAVLRHESVKVGTDTYVLKDIQVIRIEDHYLNITTTSGRSMQRAKLSLIDKLHTGSFGIQINRSIWVAFSAIKDVQPAKNGQILLILINGDEELVAKPRVYAFRHAFRSFTDSIG